MVQRQAAIDPFGLGRLSDTLRQGRIDQQNRQLQSEQSVTRGLQQQLLGGQVQQQQQTLADLAAGRQQQTDLQTALGQDTGESQTLKGINFLREKNPQQAQEIITKTITTAGNIAKFSGQGAIDFVNKELGTSWELLEDTPETMLVDQKDKKVLIRKADGVVIKEFPVAATPSGGKVQLKEGLDSSGKQVFFNFDPSTGTVPEGIRPLPEKGEIIESTPGGGFKITRGSVGGVTQKKFTEVQSKSGGFADRVKRSGQILNDLEDTPEFEPALLSETIAASIPLVGNALLSPDKQRYEQAKRDFVTAILRLESGAAISDSEFVREDKKFFPQIGDAPGVIAQKRDSRAKQFDILKAGSAGAFDVIQEQRKRDKAPPPEITKPVSELTDTELLEALDGN
jgi:hypothetical protein